MCRPPADEADACAQDGHTGEHDHEGNKAGNDEVADRIDGHDAKGFDLLIDLHRAEFGRHGGSAATHNNDSHKKRA
ncbi:MAG: hypothetical protein ABR82_00535 [Verrucomicrobia subdivision 6 bacterium BACL9 MAG-120507-bin52]|uniref:Uncharacterized protein n=1 Tax=Verrucomicrobia subdivision 6 bacterium BACL9 MAG-120507-bin52 TaxID=1655590 RepID=A0A0R2RJ59_9BACT|nr:MAG: hypothetical protein ABR82_00535 [Verrucomicrobia subdivision 6 bacterium BACL9 MAG-120507-bin52]